jgi:hypothetical protein
MKKEDIEFLKDLQHEMLTQDTVCQASPRFWVVMQTVKDYWVDDNINGMFIYSSNDGEGVFEGDLAELTEWIMELDGVEDCSFETFSIDFNYKNTKFSIYDVNDLQNFLDQYDDGNYQAGYYRNRDEIVEDTMFLTVRECKEHINANKHNYNETVRSYAMTAWRSPQVARLYKILENTNWEDSQNNWSNKWQELKDYTTSKLDSTYDSFELYREILDKMEELK